MYCNFLLYFMKYVIIKDMDKQISAVELGRVSVEDLYAQLTDVSPKIVTMFTPSNRAEQEKKFLSGEVRNPQFVYEKLDAADFGEAIESIQQLDDSILNHPDLPADQQRIYQEFIETYQKQTELLSCAQAYQTAESEADKQDIAKAYKQLSREIYGTPNEKTYRSLLGDVLQQIADKDLSGAADNLRQELFRMVNFDASYHSPERFRPSADTIDWMNTVARSLYGGMLAHVPEDQPEFNPREVQTIFTDIIAQEFGDAAIGWSVSIEKATSVCVKSSEKKIVIPDNDMNRSQKKVEELVVHELGVHMLRAITGGETDTLPLANGLGGYYDAEEGLGVVMEQALRGKFIERGVDHYITAGLAYYDGKDFREAFEAKWRLSLLSSITAGDQVDDAKIMRAKKVAFTQTLRSFRGTNDLPLFKDLSYYNGSTEVWKYLESIRGDDLQLALLLAGKVNTSKEHQRAVLESRSV
mgnify:CR=1 FL=1